MRRITLSIERRTRSTAEAVSGFVSGVNLLPKEHTP